MKVTIEHNGIKMVVDDADNLTVEVVGDIITIKTHPLMAVTCQESTVSTGFDMFNSYCRGYKRKERKLFKKYGTTITEPAALDEEGKQVAMKDSKYAQLAGINIKQKPPVFKDETKKQELKLK